VTRLKKYKNGQYVLAAAPGAHSKELSEAQRAHCDKFRNAIIYAKAAKTSATYQEVAKSRGQTAFNVAVADFLHPPEIQGIDLSSYHGAPNQPITITAVDDVKVKTVGVILSDARALDSTTGRPVFQQWLPIGHIRNNG